jgi:hypothetical protein
MRLQNKEDYPKEITISLEKYKVDREINIKCFVAHDYVGIEANHYIEDVNENGYYTKQYIQIPINVMKILLEKLKDTPFLNDEHYNNKSYLYKDEVVLFEEWHLPKEVIPKSEILFREEGETEWTSVPKDKWCEDKLKILKGLK